MRLFRRRGSPVSPPSSDEIRLKVLDEAEVSTMLGHLLYSLHVSDRLVYQASSLDETRDIVRALLLAGHLAAFERHADRTEPLEIEKALAAVADDGNWLGYNPDGFEVIYEVELTDSGEAEYRRLRRLLESDPEGRSEAVSDAATTIDSRPR